MFVIIGVISFLNNSSCINILIGLQHRVAWEWGSGTLLFSVFHPAFRFNQESRRVSVFFCFFFPSVDAAGALYLTRERREGGRGDDG